MNKYLFFLFIIIITGCNQNSKKESFSKNENNEFQHIIDSAAVRLINKPLINSASVGVVYKSEKYTGHYGELEKTKGNPPTDKTIYEIGSLSKVFTGTLAAKAVLEEKINLEDNVQQYLEEDYPNLNYENKPLKIKHLLTHSSGLPNILPLSLNPLMTSDFLKQDSPSKIDSILNDYDKKSFLQDLHSLEIDTIPGHNYSYSTAGTELIAGILENIYQKEFETLLADFLSVEIGMDETVIALDQKKKENLAVGYHADHPEITLPMGKLPWGAGGGIKSTVPDMLKFMEFQLDNNKIVRESHKVLKDYSDEVGVAYFWEVDASNPELGKYYSHHGGVPRSQCFLFIIPKHELGIFIITNQSGKDTASKMKNAIDEIIDGVIKYNEQNLARTEKTSQGEI
ncbi:serine hydrolase domain-containing protein [uncultured Salegentibacter sp.]|uniref:serine hydrolase domain-containing protein n=1 Tax=uncultured Salegentibacter sp. TaxID=259320 RepID=UPI0030DACBAC